MKCSFSIIASAIACAQLVAAVTVPANTPTHFFSSKDSSLVLAPVSATSGAALIASAPGDGSSSDITALQLALGSGVPTALYYPGVCVTNNGVALLGALYVDTCEPRDTTQNWTYNPDDGTISNASGCITLGGTAVGDPITITLCSGIAEQIWNPVTAS